MAIVRTCDKCKQPIDERKRKQLIESFSKEPIDLCTPCYEDVKTYIAGKCDIVKKLLQ